MANFLKVIIHSEQFPLDSVIIFYNLLVFITNIKQFRVQLKRYATDLFIFTSEKFLFSTFLFTFSTVLLKFSTIKGFAHVENNSSVLKKYLSLVKNRYSYLYK